MAHCYESDELHMYEEAIKCYKRAANCQDTEAIAVNRLAKLYDQLGCHAEAAIYYKKDLERMEAEEREGPNLADALVFLAKYYKAQNKFEEAEIYCTRLLDYNVPVSYPCIFLFRFLMVAVIHQIRLSYKLGHRAQLPRTLTTPHA